MVGAIGSVTGVRDVQARVPSPEEKWRVLFVSALVLVNFVPVAALCGVAMLN